MEVGTLETGEIDFIATRFEEKKYFQVAFHLNDDIIDREFGIYNNIWDNYLKYVISNDTFDFSQNRIIRKNIIDFLLDKKIMGGVILIIFKKHVNYLQNAKKCYKLLKKCWQ